jgi:hypothetical protein
MAPFAIQDEGISRIRLELVMSLRLDRSTTRAALIATLISAGLLVGPPSFARAQQPTGPGTPRPATHTVKRGDTLWDLAKLYLGDAFLWPEIYRINTDQIEDPHWIYPGEVLKLPSDASAVIAAAPAASAPEPVRVTPMVAAPAPVQPRRDTTRVMAPQAAVPTVRMGEYVASPWVDQREGPRGSGFVIGSRDLPGIATEDRSRLNLYDAVLISPPVGSVAPEHERFLTYRLGPLLEDLGQIVIPTGVIEITRSARNGEAAIGRVVKMFDLVQAGQRLIALDSSAAVLSAQPAAVAHGREGKVRWVYGSPVLPSGQNYVVLDISRRDLSTGDQVDLYEPRKRPADEGQLATPEVWIARAQVLRVTPFGATAIILHQEQPKIDEGTAARIAAKMP